MDGKQQERSHRAACADPKVLWSRTGLRTTGRAHEAAKTLKGFGNATVLELVEDDSHGTYRAVYTVRFEQAVFVLHCFQKKSKSGVATPKKDLDIIRIRLRAAEALAKEMQLGKAKNERH